MTSRERVRKAINHQQPDKVPIDLGATPATGIQAGALAKLRRALKLEDRKVKLFEPFQMLGFVEDDVIQAVNADIIGLWSDWTFFGFENKNWKSWRLQDGTEVLVSEDFAITQDNSGVTYIHPKGNLHYAPSAKLPKGGYYFDAILREEPVDEDNLNGREDFKEQFQVFSENECKHYEKTAEYLYNNTQYSIIGNYGGMALGDAGLLPGIGLSRTPGIRKVEEWYVAHIIHPKYIKEVYEFQTEIAMKNLKLYKEAVGDKIDVIYMSGADFGTQKAELMSPDMFREFYKPYFKKVNEWIHENTTWKTFYHSCGSIVNLLDDFTDMGVDILNPIQCSAYGMEPKFLKEKYGDKLTFWGGAIDTQKTLPFGTPEDVRKEALERLGVFSKGGGFIYNAIHNIQHTTPVENIVAFYEAAMEYNNK